MHQYLDSDGSGTSDQCVSSTIGAERLQVATQWLKDNNKKGFLGEIGAGSNQVCIDAVKSALCTMQTAGGVWIGVAWWAAGPWWGTVSVVSQIVSFVEADLVNFRFSTSNRSSPPMVLLSLASSPRPSNPSCKRKIAALRHVTMCIHRFLNVLFIHSDIFIQCPSVTTA